jgi:hypothetical protein
MNCLQSPPANWARSRWLSGADQHESESFARKLAAASPLDESVRVRKRLRSGRRFAAASQLSIPNHPTMSVGVRRTGRATL